MSGAPVGWAQAAVELEPGVHWVDLSFYGLMFHDRAVSGPLRLGAVALTTTGAMPNGLSDPLIDAYVTRPVKLQQMTAQPFGRRDLLRAADQLEGRAPRRRRGPRGAGGPEDFPGPARPSRAILLASRLPMEPPAAFPLRPAPDPRVRRLFWGLLAATLAVKLVLAAAMPVLGDEAYFFLWGAHPALGYYDHPPLVGWILAGLMQVGHALAWLRLPSVLLSTLMALGAVALLGRRPYSLDEDGATRAYWIGVLFLLLPIHLLGVFVLTDTPLVLFSFASGVALMRAAEDDDLRWYALSGSPWGWRSSPSTSRCSSVSATWSGGWARGRTARRRGRERGRAGGPRAPAPAAGAAPDDRLRRAARRRGAGRALQPGLERRPLLGQRGLQPVVAARG